MSAWSLKKQHTVEGKEIKVSLKQEKEEVVFLSRGVDVNKRTVTTHSYSLL